MWLAMTLLLLQQQEKEVVITAQRRESDVLDVPSGVTVVTREQIEKSGASNLIEALSTVPGFFPQGPNKGAADAIADLRGYNNGSGNGQRTLVLVDGRRTYNPIGGATDWASIALGDIERIEIVRGPACAIYGDPALAGVINIITRRGSKEKQTVRVSGHLGTFATYGGSFEARGGTADVLYSAFGSAERTDGWRDNSAYRGLNFSGRIEVPIDDQWTAHLKVGGHEDDRRRPGTLTQAQIDTLGRDATVTPNDFGARSEVFADVVIVYDGGALGEFSAQLSGTRGESSGFFDFGIGTFDSDDEFDLSALYLKSVVDVPLFGLKWKFTTGLDLAYEEARAFSSSVFFGTPSTTDADYVRRMVGAFEHLEVRPFDPLVVTAGVRWDRALLGLDRDTTDPFGFSFDRQRAFDQWSPQAGITWNALEEVSVYAGYGRPFKYPTRDELNGFTAADPQLVPERAHSLEAGTRVRWARWGQFGAAYYRMDVKDEIYFNPSTFTNLNFDKVRHQGIESELRLTPFESDAPVRVEVFGTYTYTRAVIQSAPLENRRYPVTPAHLGTAGGTVRVGDAFLTVTGRVVGRRFLISDTSNSFDQLPSYALMDAKIGYTWGRATASLSAFNVFDRDYDESGGLGFAGVAFNPGPERSWLLSLEVEF